MDNAIATTVDALIEHWGEPWLMLAVGLTVGMLFGVTAQQSRFCLRAATLAFWRGHWDSSVAVWLMAFSAALLVTQGLILTGNLDADRIRQLTTNGTLSGAVIGGALFGVGMVLARGCASRLLVLSATGNLRALITGLALTLVAQASLRGILSPARLELSQLWVVPPETRNMLEHTPEGLIWLLGPAGLVLALWLAHRNALQTWTILCALGVGAAIALGWALTNLVAVQSFEIVAVQSVTFTGPSTDTLMALIHTPSITPSFALGLVPGVFVGALVAALVSGQFVVEGFEHGVGLPRYLSGAALMGFGSMLAGGCAVGAGVTGGSVLALTAWAALTMMWAAAGITGLFVDRDEHQSREMQPLAARQNRTAKPAPAE